MKPGFDLSGKRVLVVGLARTGLVTALFSAGYGATVTATDERPETELAETAQKLRAAGVKLELGYRYLDYGKYVSGASHCFNGTGASGGFSPANCGGSANYLSTANLASQDFRVGLRWTFVDTPAYSPPPEPEPEQPRSHGLYGNCPQPGAGYFKVPKVIER